MSSNEKKQYKHRTVLMRAPFSGDGHTIIANRASRDRRLSWKARGILLHLGSHVEGWQTSEENLVHEAPDGLASVRAGLMELESAGYLYRFRERHPDGRLGDSVWIFSDDPDALPFHVQVVLARMQAEGRRLEQLPVRRPKTKRSAKTAEPTCENRIQVDDEQNRRSEPTCEKPKEVQPMLADRMLKKTNREGEGEEKDARARADDPAPEPEPGAAPPVVRPVRGHRIPYTQADVDVIDRIVARTLTPDQSITAAELDQLATKFASAAAGCLARSIATRDELVRWLGHNLLHPDGTPAWRDTLAGVLAYRLRPDVYPVKLPVWLAEQRAHAEGSGPSGNRDEPFDLKSKPAAPGVCGVHRTTLTPDSRCLVCESETEAENVAYGVQSHAGGPPTENPEEIARIIQEALDGAHGAADGPEAAVEAVPEPPPLEELLAGLKRTQRNDDSRRSAARPLPPAVAEARARLEELRQRTS